MQLFTNMSAKDHLVDFITTFAIFKDHAYPNNPIVKVLTTSTRMFTYKDVWAANLQTITHTLTKMDMSIMVSNEQSKLLNIFVDNDVITDSMNPEKIKSFMDGVKKWFSAPSVEDITTNMTPVPDPVTQKGFTRLVHKLPVKGLIEKHFGTAALDKLNDYQLKQVSASIRTQAKLNAEMYSEKALEFTAEQISQINDLIEASPHAFATEHIMQNWNELWSDGYISSVPKLLEHMRGIRFIKKSMEGLVFAIAGRRLARNILLVN